MSKAYIALVDPLFPEEGPTSARCGGKALVVMSLFIGFGCAVVGSGAFGQYVAEQQPVNTMAVLPKMPQSRSATTPFCATKNALKMYGIGSSPMEKLAIAAVGAVNGCNPTRDVRMMAQNLDRETQVRLSSAAASVEVKAEELAGMTAPMSFFDPLGLAAKVDGKSLLFYREAELKHGRVGMIASLGIVVGEKFHPLYGGNIDGTAASALQETALKDFWPVLLVACGGLELLSGAAKNSPYDGAFSGYKIKDGWSAKDGAVPGDFGFDPLGLKPSDPAKFLELQNKELNNGRLAMLAAAGMLAAELKTGQKLF